MTEIVSVGPVSDSFIMRLFTQKQKHNAQSETVAAEVWR